MTKYFVIRPFFFSRLFIARFTAFVACRERTLASPNFFDQKVLSAKASPQHSEKFKLICLFFRFFVPLPPK